MGNVLWVHLSLGDQGLQPDARRKSAKAVLTLNPFRVPAPRNIQHAIQVRGSRYVANLWFERHLQWLRSTGRKKLTMKAMCLTSTCRGGRSDTQTSHQKSLPATMARYSCLLKPLTGAGIRDGGRIVVIPLAGGRGAQTPQAERSNAHIRAARCPSVPHLVDEAGKLSS